MDAVGLLAATCVLATFCMKSMKTLRAFAIASNVLFIVYGAGAHPMQLTFVRLEPLVVAKRTLSGYAAERVDTRTLQVVYEIEADGALLFPGQQVDVLIAADRFEAQAGLKPGRP